MFRHRTELKTGPEEEKKPENSTVKPHISLEGEGRHNTPHNDRTAKTQKNIGGSSFYVEKPT